MFLVLENHKVFVSVLVYPFSHYKKNEKCFQNYCVQILKTEKPSFFFFVFFVFHPFSLIYIFSKFCYIYK